MSDWIAVMDRGEVVQWGRPWELYYRPSTPFLADFLGTVNLVRVSVVEALNGRLRIRLPGAVTGSGVVDVSGFAGHAGGEAVLCIRPETLRLLDEHDPVPPGVVVLAGDVTVRTFLGRLMRYSVSIAGQEWLVDQPDPGAARVLDGSVRVAVNPLRIHVISVEGNASSATEAEHAASESPESATEAHRGA